MIVIKGYPELTLKQKNQFLNHAIKRYSSGSNNYICPMFRDWYKDNINNPSLTIKEREDVYVLVTFPELLEIIRRRLLYQNKEAYIDHQGKELAFNPLDEYGIFTLFDEYRLKLIQRVKVKINRR